MFPGGSADPPGSASRRATRWRRATRAAESARRATSRSPSSAATLRLGDDERRASSVALVEALRGPAQLAHAPDQVTVVEIELEVEGAHDLELLGNLTYAEIEAALRDRASRRRRHDLR